MLVKMGNHDHHLKGLLLLLLLFFFFSSFPSSSSCTSVTMQDGLSFQQLLSTNSRSFEISGDMFVKDGLPFRILGGEVHYFRILPQVRTKDPFALLQGSRVPPNCRISLCFFLWKRTHQISKEFANH